MLFNMSVGYEI